MNQSLEHRTDSTGRDGVREQFAALNQDLRRFGHLTKEVAKEYVQSGRKKISDAGAHVTEYVRAKPARSLGIAASAGILLGYLLARRRR